MYSLPQAGLLAQQFLEQRLATRGYYQSKLTPGFWKHKWRPIQFSLVVDDVGIKYVGKEHAIHLKQTLEEHYNIWVDWEGKKYLGLTLDWDYDKREVHVSMPGYIQKALTRFQHEKPKRPQNQPYPHTPPNYGAKQQFTEDNDTSTKLGADGQQFVQQVTGTFLFYARAVDPTMLTALRSLASE